MSDPPAGRPSVSPDDPPRPDAPPVETAEGAAPTGAAPVVAPTRAPTRAGLLVRSVAGLLLGLGVAAGVIWKLGVDLGAVARHVAEAPRWVIAVSVASGFVNFALQSLRWHAVMRPLLGLRYAEAYRAQVVGFMFNQLLPMRGGDLLRVQYLGRRTGKSRAAILGTEVVDRWLDLWGPIPTIAVLAVVTDLPGWVFKALALFGGITMGVAVTIFALTRRGWTPRPGSRFAGVFGAFRVGIAAFRSKRILLLAFTLAPLPWLWEAFVLSLVGRGFGIDLGLAKAFCVLVGFNAAMVVPSPGAVGTIESGGTAALAWFGADLSTAFAFITVYHFCQMIPGILAGVVILAAQGEQLFGKAEAPTAGP